MRKFNVYPDGTITVFYEETDKRPEDHLPTTHRAELQVHRVSDEEELQKVLSPEHQQSLLEESGIVPKVVLARGYFTASNPEKLRELGFPEYQSMVPALVIPVYGVDGKLRFHRTRPDNPRPDRDRPGKDKKYEQPGGTGVALDVPPGVRPALSDPGEPLWIVEGEKKADALASHGECAIALLGVWSWKRDGLPLPDCDYIRLVGREVRVAFDSDAERKVEVRLARSTLARYLMARGAMVRIVRLPDAEDGSKQGVDDYLVGGGTVESLIELSEAFDGAEPPPWDWPIMAEEAGYGLAGEIIRTIEPNTESDPAGLTTLFLTDVGNVIGRGAHFKVEEDNHYCKINPVLVGETSKGRKGTAQNRLNRLVKRIDPEWYENCTASGLSTGEGLIHRLRDAVVEEGEDGELKVKDPGVEDKRLLTEESEFAQALTVMRREGNTLSMAIRNAWDDKPMETLTKTSHEKATDTHVSIIGHVTRRELVRHLNEEKLGAGIGNRFVFTLVRRSKRLPHGGDKDIFTEDQIHRLREAIRFGKEWREIGLSGKMEAAFGYSAKELWEEIYDDLSEGKPGLFGAVVSRAEAYVRRIATVYAVLDLSEVVRVPHLLAALAVWQYCEQSAYLIFGDRIGDALADELLEALRDAGAEGMTRNEIYEYFGKNQRAARLSSVLKELERAGLARWEKEKTDGRGRPTQRWFATEAQ